MKTLFAHIIRFVLCMTFAIGSAALGVLAANAVWSTWHTFFGTMLALVCVPAAILFVFTMGYRAWRNLRRTRVRT